MINSQAKGKRAERELVAWLKTHGWPDARRHVRTGDLYAPDEGDIRLDGGVVIEVKHHAGGLTDGQVRDFLAKLTQRQCKPGELGILVERRERVSDAGRWWAWLMLGHFRALVDRQSVPAVSLPSYVEPVRVHVRLAFAMTSDYVERSAQTATNVERGALGLADPVDYSRRALLAAGDTNCAPNSTRVTQAFARNPFLDAGDAL